MKAVSESQTSPDICYSNILMISPFKPHKTAVPPPGAPVTDGEPRRGSLLLQVIDGRLSGAPRVYKEKKAIRARQEEKERDADGV